MKDSSLVLHKGALACTREELASVPLPAQTETYQPVGHFELTSKILTIAQDILGGFTLARESYGMARDGSQLFAVLQFENSSEELLLAIGFCNSYDKSIRLRMASGATVFVCDNLALSGEIVIMRKHTKRVWDWIEENVVKTISGSRSKYDQIQEDVGKFKSLAFSNDDGFAHLGRLYGNDIISPRQLPVAKSQWINSDHEDFKPRNAWSLYNAITESLKTSAPHKIMEKHVYLHNYFKNLDGVPVQDIEVERIDDPCLVI